MTSAVVLCITIAVEILLYARHLTMKANHETRS